MFVNGDLKGKFIMDRNLGARDTKYAEDGIANLYYSFGRKDPYPGGVSGSVTTAYVGRGEMYEEDIFTLTSVTGSVSIATTVNNPMIKYSNRQSNWCEEVNSESIIWHDYEQDVANNGKSLFDPSPKGWKIPADGTWADFETKMTDWVSYVSEGDQAGRSYPLADDKFAYYPAHGHRTTSGSNIADSLTAPAKGQYWSSTPSSSILSRVFYYTESFVLTSDSHGRSAAYVVRCVQHNE